MNSPAIYIYIYISYYNPNMADILESPIYIMLHHLASEPCKLVYFLPEYRSPTRHAYVAGGSHPNSTTRGWDVM